MAQFRDIEKVESLKFLIWNKQNNKSDYAKYYLAGFWE